MTRNNMFADLTMNLIILKLVGEVGRVSGRHGDHVQHVLWRPGELGTNYASAGGALQLVTVVGVYPRATGVNP